MLSVFQTGDWSSILIFRNHIFDISIVLVYNIFMSDRGEEPSFSEQYLRLMNDRPNEDIPGMPEWEAKIFRLADEREISERAALKRARNIGLGLVAVSAAVFGVDQAADFATQEEMVGMLGIFGGSGLGTAIGAQLGLIRR
jgi:hypothetical protein